MSRLEYVDRTSFDAMEYWIEEDVYVTIQRVRKVQYCDPCVIQVHDHIDFDRDQISPRSNGTITGRKIHHHPSIVQGFRPPNDTLWNRPIVLYERSVMQWV